MSCKDCEIVQAIVIGCHAPPNEPPIAYVRVGTANVAIIGCDKHLKELIAKLRGVEEN